MFYLASPYNHPSEKVRARRYQENIKATAELLKTGKVVFSPIVHNHPIVNLYGRIGDWEFWRDIDFHFLERCEGLIVLKLSGWENSIGVTAEIEFAKKINIPIEFIEADEQKFCDCGFILFSEFKNGEWFCKICELNIRCAFKFSENDVVSHNADLVSHQNGLFYYKAHQELAEANPIAILKKK